MLLPRTFVGPSKIHGFGLFAVDPISAGSLVWSFCPPDHRMALAEMDEQLLHFCYINPANPKWAVLCGDSAIYWNFSAEPNCREAHPPTGLIEAPIIAARDIAAGEELTIGFETDADAKRKLATYNISTHY